MVACLRLFVGTGIGGRHFVGALQAYLLRGRRSAWMMCQPNWVRTGALIWPGLRFVDGFFKWGNHHAVGKPAQVAAVAGAAVLRVLACQTAEICAAAGL